MKTLRRGLLLVLLLGAAYVGFRWGPAVFPRLESWVGSTTPVPTGAEVEPSPELAEATLDRFEALRTAAPGERLMLGGAELTSVVRYSLPGLLPPGVTDPEVRLRDGKVHLTGRVATDAFARLPALDQVVGLLPDTLSVELRGSLIPYDQVNLALVVDRIVAGRIPVPSALVGDVLNEIGGSRRRNAPDDALTVPLLDGLESVFVQRDSLVLVSEGRERN